MSETSADSRPGPPAAILLVEDDPIDAELTMRALQRGQVGARVQQFSDGDEVLDFLFGRGAYAGRQATPLPRVILLDLKLPRVSGLDVLRAIKADPRTRPVPVVVLTSSAEERDVSACHELGANSYVVKPIASEEFNQTIVQVGAYWMRLNRSPRA